jgi:hypothetical protein
MADMRAFYDRGDEQGRLGDWGRLEFLRTRELLSRFLPAPPAGVPAGATRRPSDHSTVTVLARLRGWSTLRPRRRAIR